LYGGNPTAPAGPWPAVLLLLHKRRPRVRTRALASGPRRGAHAHMAGGVAYRSKSGVRTTWRASVTLTFRGGKVWPRPSAVRIPLSLCRAAPDRVVRFSVDHLLGFV